MSNNSINRPAVQAVTFTETNLDGKLYDLMEAVKGQQRHFDAASRRALQGHDINAGLAAGVIVSVGDVTICDADGSPLEPEESDEGFALTDEGNSLLAAYDAARDARFKAALAKS